MIEHPAVFWIGLGVLISLWLSIMWPQHRNALDECAKTNNVYQCEMVAVPKKGDK